MRDTTVTCLSIEVVLHALCMLTWPWPDPRSRSRSRAFELPTTSEAVHAGGDDRSPLAGLSGLNVYFVLLYVSLIGACLLSLYYHHHHNCFTALFPGPPGWAGARRELLDFMVQGKINRGRCTDHLAGCHSIRTNQCPPPPSPHFFTDLIPFLLPNQQLGIIYSVLC